VWTFFHINGERLGGFDVDDAERFMTDVATNGAIEIEFIAGKLLPYAASSR
jgi:death-on-curing protein